MTPGEILNYDNKILNKDCFVPLLKSQSPVVRFGFGSVSGFLGFGFLFSGSVSLALVFLTNVFGQYSYCFAQPVLGNWWHPPPTKAPSLMW